MKTQRPALAKAFFNHADKIEAALESSRSFTMWEREDLLTTKFHGRKATYDDVARLREIGRSYL